MTEHASPPLAGLLRVIFFLSIAALAISTVAIGVTTVYEAPSGDDVEFENDFGFDSFFEEQQDKADYDRNVGLILSLIGSATIAVGILGLGSRFNHLRTGLLAAGVALTLGACLPERMPPTTGWRSSPRAWH